MPEPSAHEQIVEIINHHIPDGDFNASEVAEKAYNYLLEQHPELDQQWKDEMGFTFFRQTVTSILRSRRLHERRRMKAGAFREDLHRAGMGNIEPLKNFSVTYVIDEGNTRRKLADMTGDDHRFVASSYEYQGNNALLLAEFHKAVAKRVGRSRTEDVMTEEEYARLYNSIVQR